MASAIGLIAGPESPPVIFASHGFPDSTSTFKPTKVLISDKASAPPSSAAKANSVISFTLGESFMIRNLSVTFRTDSTASLSVTGSELNRVPPFSTLGQETFISSASILLTSDNALANSTYSATVSPKKLTISRV